MLMQEAVILFTELHHSFEQIIYNLFIRASVDFHLGLSTLMPSFLQLQTLPSQIFSFLFACTNV